MRDYRLYMLNNIGRFVGVVEMTAHDDAAAIASALAHPDEVAKELWDHDRLVETFEPPRLDSSP